VFEVDDAFHGFGDVQNVRFLWPMMEKSGRE
jgi:hypothetical protein